jgi:hypothetical protein
VPACHFPRTREGLGGLVTAVVVAALAYTFEVAVLAETDPGGPLPSAARIVERNIAARGGLEAWRRIETMVWEGHAQSGWTPTVPFTLEQKRPNKTRFEVRATDGRTLRVFDGAQGWIAHEGQDQPAEDQPYPARELAFARHGHVIDGVLLHAAVRGEPVALEAVEVIDGRRCYRLLVARTSGERERVWVDARSFLEVRWDRTTTDSAGHPHVVTQYYRDYRNVDGIRLPATIDTGAGTGGLADRLSIERVTLNVAVEDAAFSRPGARGAHIGPAVPSSVRDSPAPLPPLTDARLGHARQAQ